MIEWYLEPLKEETFLSVEDIERLFGNIQEIVQFQKQFLHSLEQAVDQEASATADSIDSVRFKVLLIFDVLTARKIQIHGLHAVASHWL